MDRDDATRGGFEPPGHKAPITPDDVQRKEFGTARVRVGYVMHEVDEFLDEITDTLSSLLSENQRLRAQLAAAPPSAGGTPSPSTARATDDADRTAVEAFLQREKSFLQSLGSLVQEHAEALRGMVRSVREPDAVPATSPSMEAPSAEVSPMPASPTSEPSEPAAATEAAATEAPVSEPTVSEPTPIEPTRTAEGPDDARDEAGNAILDGEDDTGAIEAIEAEEPIRLDEPEPTGTRRRDDPSEGSLRELFWGED